jgi:hypothetical protein
MPRFICKLKDHYFEWSTIVDDIVTDPMTLADFKKYYEVEYGRSSMSELEGRMKRVEEKGTSAELYNTVDELIPVKKQRQIMKLIS